MNTPSAEMLKEAIRHMKRQNNYEKWELLFPLSKNHHVAVDFQRFYFVSPASCCDADEDDNPLILPLDAVFGTLIRDNFLYILCENQMMYILGLDSDLWSLQFPVECPSLVVQLLWRCQCSTKRVGRWLIRHKKTPSV